MRKRSMSVFVAKGDDRLSRKFEGVASDNDAHFDSEDESKEEPLPDEWTKADYDSLLAQLRELIPKKDHRKWKTTLQAVNWELIKIRQHTPQEVENMAKQLIGKVRSFRTFGEMVNDVPEVVNKILRVDRPKPPLTAYSLFVKEMLPHLREERKDLKVQEIFKLVPKLFQELSTKKRRRFEDAAARQKEEYRASMSKFYLDHPERTPKLRKEPLKTPFQLFYQSRRSASDNLSCQQARKEWEELPLKKKVKYIRASFEAQNESDSKLLNKKEQEILDHDLGKPEFVGRNAYEFFRRKVRSNYSMSNGKQRDTQIRLDYKKLDSQEQLKLKEEFQEARAAFIYQYQQYIKKLPIEKQQVEIDYLKTISDKATKKAELNTKKTAMKDEFHSTVSDDECIPVAESTTINKKKLSTGKKEKRKQPDSDEESDNRSSPKKQSKFSTVTATPPPSTSKAPVLLNISKSEPTSSSASSSDEEEDFKSSKASTSRNSVPASPSKNGSAPKLSDSKKRTTVDVVKPEIEVKKPKKTQTMAKLETPPPPPVIKATKPKESSAKKLQEPERPPKEVHEFYRQRFYKGKVGKHVESYENLTFAKKREIGEQLKAAQKQYIVDFELYLKSLPKDEIRKYIQKVNAQKQPESTDDDSDDGDTEEGSSSEEEEEEDD